MELPTDKRFINLLSNPPRRFGFLTVIGYAGRKMVAKRLRNFWYCLCDCGNKTEVKIDHLTSGRVLSCGCYGRRMLTTLCIKHHKSRTKVYNTFIQMKARCYNPNNNGFKNYGGRGIKVCDRWLEGFENFYEDIGDPPSKDYSLDRIDVNGNYCKENCRWATDEQQANNTRQNVYITHNGQTLTPPQWEKLTGITASVIRHRIKKGWNVEKALTLPVGANWR